MLSVYFSQCQTDLVQQCSLVSQSQSIQQCFSSPLLISAIIVLLLVLKQKLPHKIEIPCSLSWFVQQNIANTEKRKLAFLSFSAVSLLTWSGIERKKAFLRTSDFGRKSIFRKNTFACPLLCKQAGNSTIRCSGMISGCVTRSE